MHIVITGGAGFIGHHAVWSALGRGWQVTVLDNFSTGKLENLQLPSGRLPGGLTIYECDIAEGHLPDLEGCDALLHLAAPVSVEESINNPTKYWRGIQWASERVFKWAKARGVKRIAAASTAAIYGEEAEAPFNETAIPDPMSPYAEYKLEMEACLKGFHNEALQCAALRFFNVFGEGQPNDVGYVSAIPVFQKQWNNYQPITVTGDGQQTRDFVYVGDVVEACFAVLTRSEPVAEMPILNVGTGEEVKILEIAEAFGGEIVHIAAREEPRQSLASIAAIQECVDWAPSTKVLTWIKLQK